MRLHRLFALAAVAVLAPAAPAAAQEPTELLVVESASVRVAPDTADLYASIQRRARTPVAARRLVERRLDAVLARLVATGLPREEVQTERIASYRTRREGRVRHVATTTLSIRTTRLELLGAVVGALRGTSIDGPEFSVADPSVATREATRIALARARARADDAATAMGMRVTGTVRVDLSPETGYGAGGFGGVDDEDSGGGGSAERGGDATVIPGELELFAAVAVVYALAP